ncbi:unnamed protein product [marine sediment metagenome]|uniref:Uncharacterized protein n=1 Tax=marine sediment metagenome TaxID=412755 RepID=X1BHQ2_9ZZZZ
MGIPSYWVPYNDNYLLRWIGFTEPLDNEEPVLEFHHHEPSYGYMYWYGIAHAQGHYLYDDDVDNDGETSFRYHSNSNQFNGIYDGVLYNADLIYRMYYIGEVFKPPQIYEDVIDTDKK